MPERPVVVREKPAPHPCAHCGTRVPEACGTAAYCCAGCEAVAGLLRTENLERYYELAGRKTLPIGAAPAAATHTWLEPLLEHAEASAGDVCSLELDVQGIHCTGCVWLMNETFRRQAGAVSVTVNPTLGKVRMLWRRGGLDVERWLALIEGFGYRFGPSRKTGAALTRGLTLRLGLCVALTMNVMLLSISFYFGLSPRDGQLYALFTYLSLGLSAAVVGIGGSVFFRAAWQGLRQGVLHLDLPIALGIALVFATSTAQVLSGRGGDLTYFDTLNTFVTLMLFGRWLQQRAIERNRALLLDDDGAEGLYVRRIEDRGPRPVRAPRVNADDRLLVAPGEVVPVDATLVDAQAAISLDWINGESVPHTIHEGQLAPAGCFNAGRSAMTVKARTAFADSPLATLLRAPAPVNAMRAHGALWDRLARLWSLGVLGLAGGGYALWWGLDRGRALDVATALLVVTCPCAIGIALPLARELVHLRLRRAGFFVRDPALMDRLVGVRKLLFDKTGTLTLGRLELATPVPALSPEAKNAVFTLAAGSGHPVAGCLARHFSGNGATWQPTWRVDEVPGEGVRTADGLWRLGRARFALGAPEASAEGATVLSHRGEEVARFEVTEVLRADAASSLERLQEEGFAVHLLSGDAPARVTRMAERLGVPHTHALGGLSPEDKAKVVARLDAEDTLFLGDGVNDTHAFDRASVAGTVAVERPILPGKSHFFLLGEGLDGLRLALTEARHLRAVTRKVLALALAYNAFAVTACLTGAMTPLRAAISMPASSLGLLGYTLWSLGARRPRGRTQIMTPVEGLT
ncbi:MAG: HAD family hydrolase [Myxococcales bacterium]|nr:HAD family hydrolase [Myxococcales bacterium]